MVVSNPIIPGFNPDPSCICVEGTFYLVTSSFLYFPGIPVYTSTDLRSWRQIGNVINRSSQLDYSKCRIRPETQLSGGIWAPTIRYHNGTFYVTTTLVFPDKAYDDYSRWQNMIFTSMDPFGNEWSDPVFFDYPGYDTSLFWDDDGEAYVQGSFYWRVREEISQFRIDLTNGKTLSGQPQKLWSGTGGKAPEAPHMYKKNGWYYLLIAEGGTEFGHCATIARSHSVWGPFTPCPHNPIVHAASRNDTFQTVGHADIFSDGSDRFWAVCLATRVFGDSYPMGRETCLLQIDWSGDWPVAKGGITREIDVGADIFEEGIQDVLSGKAWKDVLVPPHHHLLYLRNPNPGSYTFQPEAASSGDALSLTLRPTVMSLVSALGSPTFIGYRQQHLAFESEVTLDISRLSIASDPYCVEAGVAIYLDHEHHFVAGIRMHSTPDSAASCDGFLRRVLPAAQVSQEVLPITETLGDTPNIATLRIRGELDKYTFEIVLPISQGRWETFTLGHAQTKDVSGGFTGTLIAVFAVCTEDGRDGGTTELPEVKVQTWKYRGLK